MKKDIAARCRKIKLLILDVDGVLTDGGIVYDSRGGEIKAFDVQDGYGIIVWRRAGLKSAILSARTAIPVTKRAKDLKIDHIIQDVYPKWPAYEKLKTSLGLQDSEICYIGDDLPDLSVLTCVGLAVTVASGNREAKRVAHYVTKQPGGRGAVREVIEMILKAQKKWPAIVAEHRKNGKAQK